jgi:predicted transcriptional regulator
MLSRHLTILVCVIENEPIGILKIAEETKIPSHKVRYSLHVLEQEGLIAATGPGAVTTDNTMRFIKELAARIDNLVAGTLAIRMVVRNISVDPSPNTRTVGIHHQHCSRS